MSVLLAVRRYYTRHRVAVTQTRRGSIKFPNVSRSSAGSSRLYGPQYDHSHQLFYEFSPLRNRKGTGCPRYVQEDLEQRMRGFGEIGVLEEICVHSTPVQFLPEFIPRYLPWLCSVTR